MRRILPLLPFLFCLGCDDSSNPTSSSTAIVFSSDATLNRWVTGIGAKVSGIRGLRFKQSVQTCWVTREHLPVLLDSITALSTRKGDSLSGLTLDQFSYAMGYTRALGSLDSAQAAFSSSELGGFYIPGTNHLWVVNDTNSDTTKLASTIAHELIHALQDQNFGIRNYHPESLDADYAYKILVEGDAEYCQILYDNNNPSIDHINRNAFRDYEALEELIRGNAKLSPMPRLVSLPVLLRYSWGPRFVHDTRVTSGWSGVDSTLRHPFKTTYEMITPNSYGTFQRTNFIAFSSTKTFPAFSSLGTWSSMGSDQIGQLLLSTLMTTWANRIDPSAVPGRVAAWQGDRFWIWRKGSTRFAVGGLVGFSTNASAQTFVSNFKQLSTNAMDEKIYQADATGNTAMVAWGNLDSSEIDSLWKDLKSTTSSIKVAGRASSTLALPRFPTTPWGPLPFRH